LIISKIIAVVEKNTLFDDPTRDIQDMTTVIKQEIDKQKRSIELLSKGKNMYANKHSQTHEDTILFTLNSKLSDLTKSFKNALSKRSEVNIQSIFRSSAIFWIF
jgi:syntaxin 5